MSVDIKPYLQYLEKEKNIPKDEACALIAEAIKSSVEKSVLAGQNIEVIADPATGKLDAFAVYIVSDSPSDPLKEINPVAATALKADAKIGEEVRRPIAVSDLGRIAAMSTKQLLNQRFRKIEKDQVFKEYKDKIGDIVTGTVRRNDRGNVVVELGSAEAVLTRAESCQGEIFRTGDRIRCLLLEIREDTQRGREFVLSRAHPNFVRRLLELEVAEIADKTVKIAAMARDPGGAPCADGGGRTRKRGEPPLQVRGVAVQVWRAAAVDAISERRYLGGTLRGHNCVSCVCVRDRTTNSHGVSTQPC